MKTGFAIYYRAFILIFLFVYHLGGFRLATLGTQGLATLGTQGLANLGTQGVPIKILAF